MSWKLDISVNQQLTSHYRKNVENILKKSSNSRQPSKQLIISDQSAIIWWLFTILHSYVDSCLQRLNNSEGEEETTEQNDESLLTAEKNNPAHLFRIVLNLMEELCLVQDKSGFLALCTCQIFFFSHLISHLIGNVRRWTYGTVIPFMAVPDRGYSLEVCLVNGSFKCDVMWCDENRGLYNIVVQLLGRKQSVNKVQVLMRQIIFKNGQNPDFSSLV